MHGLINRSIQTFVSAVYGDRAWLAVARGCGAEIADFESMQCYDDAVTGQVLTAVEQVLARPRSELLSDLGQWLVAGRHPDTVRRLLRFGGVDFVEFLHSLEELPGRVRLAVPDLVLPAIELREASDLSFSVALLAPASRGGSSGRLRALPPTAHPVPQVAANRPQQPPEPRPGSQPNALPPGGARPVARGRGLTPEMLSGYADVLLGVLQAMADDYGALAMIERADAQPDGSERLEVRLFQSDYAEGRRFTLGRVSG